MTTIDTHPIRLRRQNGMKGIKHLVEYLSFHHRIYVRSRDREIQRTARDRALQALSVTDEDAYHDLATADATRFKHESMSYLRACWIAEQFGIDTSRYRREILKIVPRLHAHLPTRGIDQRMGFAVLFANLGIPRPETEQQVYPYSLIAKHAPLLFYLDSPARPYALTHEIFSMTARGSRAFPFPNEQDERYAKEIVKQLLEHSIEAESLDIAAELLVNLVQLGEAESPIAQRALEFVLQEQNEDGSFGNYAAQEILLRKSNPRYDIQVGGYLHTTYVCIWALLEMSAHH
jgi:hypothetical protein